MVKLMDMEQTIIIISLLKNKYKSDVLKKRMSLFLLTFFPILIRLKN